jgi:hypothetical protein
VPQVPVAAIGFLPISDPSVRLSAFVVAFDVDRVVDHGGPVASSNPDSPAAGSAAEPP